VKDCTALNTTVQESERMSGSVPPSQSLSKKAIIMTEKTDIDYDNKCII
jgi:hypothetical protein